MAKVKFKNAFFIEGHRYERGVQDVKDEHLDALPSTAVILKPAEAEAALAEQAARAKAASDPKSMKELRSGRANARPMGKEKKAAAKSAE